MQKRYQAVKELLSNHNQDHLLSFYGDLDEAQRERLLTEIEAQDWATLSELASSFGKAETLPPEEAIEPAPYYALEPDPDQRGTYARALSLGEDLIRQGKIAAFTVAGGQGTRLGWNGPKGTFAATPITGKPLFQVFAETLLRAERKYDTTLPWYLMTSRLNDAATRAFFAENAYFGLDEANVTFFQQGSMPSFSREGKVLLSAPGALSLNPDGHGGSLKALYESGAVKDMAERGVKHISYFQVDNPNVKAVDPLFIGLHALENADMSAKMLPKAGPDEKVGNFCLVNGRTSVIEYSDIPESLTEQRDAEGNLRFNAGSIAIHLLSVDFVRRLNEDEGGFALPYHRALKKVPYVDTETGERVQPSEPNALKLETFVFDALPLADKTVILETDRVEEFAPIKNAEGSDSALTSRQLQSERAARWLERAGVSVPRTADGKLDAVIELSPLSASSPDDVEALELPERVEAGSKLEM